MDEFWAIILAAGESRRMGFPKMLLSFNGSTMIESTIANVSGSKVNKIMVVLGAEGKRIEEITRHLPVEYCYNDNYKEGMLSSVKCGFKNISPEFKAALVFQGDQPLITPVTINTVIDAYLSSDKGLVIPVYDHKRGHPLLIDRKYIGEIAALCPATGLRSLPGKFSDDVFEVETSEEGILRDFDTYEDYLKGNNKMQ
jgi:molybdenum cofactor cytidylyltransferase